jgi:hypothetical protein
MRSGEDESTIARIASAPGIDVGALQPEKRLMLAVLEGAVSDFQKYAIASSGRGRRLFAEADAWLASTSTLGTLDFENICQALALDPSAIRTRLRAWWAARQRGGLGSGAVHVPVRRICGSRHRIVATS